MGNPIYTPFLRDGYNHRERCIHKVHKVRKVNIRQGHRLKLYPEIECNNKLDSF